MAEQLQNESKDGVVQKEEAKTDAVDAQSKADIEPEMKENTKEDQSEVKEDEMKALDDSQDFVPRPKRAFDGMTPEDRVKWMMAEYNDLQVIDPDDGMTFANKTSAMIAYERNLESQKPESERLFNDFLAQHFVGKYGKRVSDAMAAGLQPTFDVKLEGLKFEGHIQYCAARTRLISDHVKEYLKGLADSDTRQVVNLGAGLDTRAFWDDALKTCTLYVEVDSAEVNKYKNGVLDGLKAEDALPDPQCKRNIVSMDFKKETIKDLPSKGSEFDKKVPTCWILEGLIMYLSVEDNITLLTEISELSASGSLMILNFVANAPACNPDAHDKLMEKNGWIKQSRLMFGDPKFNYGKYPPNMATNENYGFSFYEKK